MKVIQFILDFGTYMVEHRDQILSLLIQHIQLTAIAVGLAILIGVPLGIGICYVKKLNKPVLGLANLIQAIPSMALLGFAIPFLGIGRVPAIVTVVLYSLLPIIKNTYTGINNISPETIEAAYGIGLTKLQVLFKVQIPLALPVIMAGVRISVVTGVGLMTMAAFIGAGGLGFLVFSGIRTVNNNQILAGALPACILALVADYLAGTVEQLVTPVSLQKEQKSKHPRVRNTITAILAVLLVVVLVMGFIPKAKADKVLVVGTKDFSEQMVLGHMIADLVEGNTDITVDRKVNLGGTQVCFSALKSGDIDLYVDYSGTVYGDTLGYPPSSDMDYVYETAKADLKEQFEIDVLTQMNFNNTYTLAVRQDTADQYNLKTFSDLKAVAGQLRMGSTLEFLNREDGLPGLVKAYGFTFKEDIGLDGAPRYIALDNNEVEVVDAFATDGLLKKFGLVVLEDDKNFFPPYYAMPLARDGIVETYPEIVPLLEDLGELLTDSVMTDLNYQVDELQLNPEDVAHDFLVQQGLLPS